MLEKGRDREEEGMCECVFWWRALLMFLKDDVFLSRNLYICMRWIFVYQRANVCSW